MLLAPLAATATATRALGRITATRLVPISLPRSASPDRSGRIRRVERRPHDDLDAVTRVVGPPAEDVGIDSLSVAAGPGFQRAFSSP